MSDTMKVSARIPAGDTLHGDVFAPPAATGTIGKPINVRVGLDGVVRGTVTDATVVDDGHALEVTIEVPDEPHVRAIFGAGPGGYSIGTDV